MTINDRDSLKKKDPKFSEGARVERAAFRAYLRRRWKINVTSGAVELDQAIRWVLSRQKRYDKKPGGLGKK